jgi:hypothetical protein
MKKAVLIIAILLVVLLLAGCAASANPNVGTANPQGGPIPGFLLGLWHGFISPVTFIISLFSKTVGIYEVYNNGNWYNLGFVLGCAVIYGGGVLGAGRRRR